MFKRLLNLSVLAVFCLSSACVFSLSSKKQTGLSTLPPEFFASTKRLAVQDFSFAEGVETNAFSPTDSAFLRSVIESKIVEMSDMKIITRKDEGLLAKEMNYKFADAKNAGDTAAKEEMIQAKLGVDAFVHGVIYEYDIETTTRKYSITAAVKIVNTSNGRIWQSKVVSASGEKNKHALFDKLATIVAKSLIKPNQGSTKIVKKGSNKKK